MVAIGILFVLNFPVEVLSNLFTPAKPLQRMTHLEAAKVIFFSQACTSCSSTR
jgi:hypothetical protein